MVEPKSPKCTMPSYVLEGVMTRESKAKPMCALRLPKSMRIEAVEIAKREGFLLTILLRSLLPKRLHVWRCCTPERPIQIKLICKKRDSQLSEERADFLNED